LSEFDLRSLLKALNGRGVRFVVIGGVAVGAHGYLRATADLDLVPDPDSKNLDQLIDALDSLDATLPTVGGRPFDSTSDAGVIRRGGNVTADTRYGGLDVVQHAHGVPKYSLLNQDAVDSDVLGVPVKVCSLGRLREMKEAQGRTQDQADLENLPDR
jgi:predicted nucleotidyltransferase